MDALLGGHGPIELEIGFGKGRFLLDRAQENPRIRFFGVETRRKWVHLVMARAKKREITNVTVRLGDIRLVIPRITPDGCLSRIFVNFPDPWWKARHAKRILLTPVLVEQISRLLAPRGELFIQTDVDFRARAYLELLCSTQSMRPLGDQGVVEVNPYGVSSLREIKCQQVGLPIYRLLFERI